MTYELRDWHEDGTWTVRERADDDTRTVTRYNEAGQVIDQRPYSDDENQAADQQHADRATLTDHETRLRAIEAVLWPAPPDPTPGQTVPPMTGLWPAGGLITDMGKVWRNVAGVPLTVPPSAMPGEPSQWTHLFVQVGGDTPSAPDAQPWSATATYTVGDKVTRSGHLWECLIPHGPEQQGMWAPSAAVPTIWRDLGVA